MASRQRQNLKKYTDEDYKGDFNILCGHRDVICRALIKSKGNIKKASKFMKMNEMNLINHIYRHDLYGFIKELKDEKRGVFVQDSLRLRLLQQIGK